MLEKLSLTVLNELFAVCRVDSKDDIPNWATKSKWFSITKTDEELSIACEEKMVPADIDYEGQWRSLKVLGPLDFALVGILAEISKVLAKNKISIFVVSTYDTDYILIKDNLIDKAVDVLKQNGCKIVK